MKTLSPIEEAFSFFLPEDTLKYFDIVSSNRTQESLRISLEEKNNPPLEERHEGKSVKSKGFKDITITDYPARGRKTLLTFRRRIWQAGDELIKRKIKLSAPGTKLSSEFGRFLKKQHRANP